MWIVLRKRGAFITINHNFVFSMSSADSKNKMFVSPRSIAIIGASEKPGVGKAIYSNIINGYKGKIYPISPTSSFVLGFKAYKSVLDVPEEIDLAVIATPNKIVPAIMEEVGKKNDQRCNYSFGRI